MSRPKVLVALSGGMDSAAVVTLLREAGYEPRALFLDMLDRESERSKARLTADMLGVELTIEPVAELFEREIIAHLLAEHGRGATPAPCSRCNPLIKWRVTAEVADRLGIFHISTGHYVRLVEWDGVHYFARGVDPAKDQSYYLWGVPESTRRRAITPLGDHTKAEIRLRMVAEGYDSIASRRESMGVCFLGGDSYGDFLRHRLRPVAGELCTEDGSVVGHHDGYQLYTIGQRRGFALDDGCGALAVTGVVPEANRVVVGGQDNLYSRVLWLDDWLLDECFFSMGDRLRVMVRGIGRNPQGGAEVLHDGDLLRIALLEDRAWAAAVGQPVAIYFGEMVVGGGILVAAER